MAEEIEREEHRSPDDSIKCHEVVDTEGSCNTCSSKSSPHNPKFDDKRTFSEELDQHKNSVIWAFGYGEEVAKKTEENINAYQKRFLAKYFMLTNNKSPGNDKIPVDPISNVESQPSSSKHIVDQKTPHSEKCIESIATRKRTRCSETTETWTSHRSRDIPLPLLPWANNSEVWQTMVYKEEATSRTRDCRLFEDPFSFLPRMRAILIDWIMEVCEVYRLRRVTYYLAVDYIDRFLTIKPSVPKHQLQLIGISSLFISAKLEEIYPPKLSEFSYVCDGACTNEDILECEILLLNTLGWDVNPMTATGWLNLYMQIYFNSKRRKEDNQDQGNKDPHFLYPQYSAFQFVIASHLIDLFSLDPGFLLFNYSIIAAAAMYFLFGRSIALKVSGLIWEDLKDCTEYMAVFYGIVRDTHDPKLQTVVMHEVDERQEGTYNALKVWIPELTTEEHHSLQTHVVDLKYFERATILRLQRMGLRVRKTYVKKKKLSEQSNDGKQPFDILDDTDVLVEVDPEDEEEPPVVMFEIEKISLESECDSDTYCNVNCENDNKTSYFSSKTKYTFDEILVGINDSTNKMLLPRKLGHDVQNEDKDN